MATLDKLAAANRIKRLLHAVFEATFNFDLEDQRKKNLGPTVKWLEKLDGTTGFTVAYVVQAALGGHAIPIDSGTVAALYVLDLVTDKDVTAGVVPGLERAVAKSKGVEFGSMLHELGADYSANPYAPSFRDILRQINPECDSRLPKRRVARAPRKPTEPPAHPDKTAKDANADGAATSVAEAKPKSALTSEKASARKKPAASSAPSTPPTSEAPKKKTPSSHELPARAASAEKALPRSNAPKKRSPSEGLSKRKPR